MTGRDLLREKSNKMNVSWFRLAFHTTIAAVLPFAFTRWATRKPIVIPLPEADDVVSPRIRNFPQPKLHKHKTPPSSTYTGQCLDDPQSRKEKAKWSEHRIDVHLQIDPDHVPVVEHIDVLEDENSTLGEGFDGYHPSGQHLLMDIHNVDHGFLTDMEALARSIVQVTSNSGLTLLSYHCHGLHAPMGTSCIGVLLESHISVHTWPGAGILSLDLFTCGPASLLPLVPLLESLFAIPSKITSAPRPVARWLYKKRGYRNYGNILNADRDIVIADQEGTDIVVAENAEGVELEWFLLGWKGFRHKSVLVTAETKFQEVAVFEISSSHVPLSREQDSFVKKNKKLFLDNVAQSSLDGIEAYHEALVHPALLSHQNPRRVMIIGGGEGATLREVLKHKNVETCTMLEIDGELVELSRQYLKEWHDCTYLASAPEEEFFSCFDDPRAQVNIVDAYKWILDRFGDNALFEEEKYDVIIMDALDPSSFVPFSDLLYGDPEFIKALTNALTPSGIVISQVGISPYGQDVMVYPVSTVLDNFINLLHKNGAVSVKTYSEGHCQFLAPWEFIIFFMSPESKARWYGEASWIDLELSKRAVATKSGSSPFRYFDGASHQTYQYHSRLQEDVFCLREPKPDRCLIPRGYDQEVPNVSAKDIETASSVASSRAKVVSFRRDVPHGSYLALDDGDRSIVVLPFAFKQVEEGARASSLLSPLQLFFGGHKSTRDFYGLQSFFVESGMLSLANYGCNHSINIGSVLEVSDVTANQTRLHLSDNDYIFDPIADRTFQLRLVGSRRVASDVSAGDELLLGIDILLGDWPQNIDNFQSKCVQDIQDAQSLAFHCEDLYQGKWPLNESSTPKSADVLVIPATLSNGFNCELN